MNLQFLEFDCSEDSEHVVCWDALAQPAARHNSALLREAAQVLTWCHRFSPRSPGALEDGADWDFDLQIHMESTAIQADWHTATQALVLSPTPSENDKISLSLSISGAAAFCAAFREHWNTP
jgi:hypothetical protein